MHETSSSDITLLGLHVCVYKEISCAPRLERLLHGKGFEKYAHKDSYKEKTSTSRKRCQPFIIIKTSIPSLTKIRIIHPSSRTLEWWEVLTWPSKGIWWADTTSVLSARSSLFVLCRCCFKYVRTMWLTVDFLASSWEMHSKRLVNLESWCSNCESMVGVWWLWQNFNTHVVCINMKGPFGTSWKFQLIFATIHGFWCTIQLTFTFIYSTFSKTFSILAK